MERPYNKRFMEDNDFISLLEMCGACAAEVESDGLEMLMANLAKIHEYSAAIMAMLSRNNDVEDWVEDKISKASQSLSDVKHYIEYRNSAYAGQSRAIEMHGGDLTMGQKLSVSSGQFQHGGRIQGERMPVMSQVPEMTPQSRMGMLGMSDDDYGDDYESNDEDIVISLSEAFKDNPRWMDDQDEEVFASMVRNNNFSDIGKYHGDTQDLIDDTDDYLSTIGQNIPGDEQGAWMYGTPGKPPEPQLDKSMSPQASSLLDQARNILDTNESEMDLEDFASHLGLDLDDEDEHEMVYELIGQLRPDYRLEDDGDLQWIVGNNDF